MRENKWGKALRILMIVIICAACLIPFYVLLVLSLNAPSRVFYEGNIFVPNFHWQNFIDAWKKSKIGTAMLNSAIITAGTLGVSVIAGGLAGYAIARYATRYNKFVFGLLIGCMMIPGIINTVPLYVLMRQINAIDTLWGMVCVCSALAMPSAVFIYATFIRALPRELDEAGKIDGCSWYGIFARIILPLIIPALVTCAIFAFMWKWDDFLASLLYLNAPRQYTVSIALKMFSDPNSGSDWGSMFAMSTLSLLPIMLIFIFCQKYLVEGISTEGLKG